jgi:hypothetical protein
MKNSIKILSISIILFLIFLLVVLSLYIYEGFVNIVYKSWMANPDDPGTVAIFQKLFGHLNNYNTVEIHSGDPPKDKDSKTLYVQYSGEPSYDDPSLYDINFIPTNPIENSISFPYGAFQSLEHDHNDKFDINYFVNKRTLDKEKTKFCLFCVSNGGPKERTDFFNSLSTRYKKVDSCGKHLNNGVVCPGNHGTTEYHEFISNYKFMICFENTSKPGYFTEKLVNAYHSGTIPIYWGDPNISNYVNIDAILYLKPNFTEADVDELINKIKELDTNDELYKQKYEQSFFKNGIVPDEFNLDKIKEKVDDLLSEV